MGEEVTEMRVEFAGIQDWRRLRDEIAPALHRDFPGVLIVVSECVVESSIPEPAWKGASLKVVGLERRTTDMLIHAMVDAFGYDMSYSGVTVTFAEAKQLAALRGMR